jgi:membrane-associated phospholipid phosphatase
MKSFCLLLLTLFFLSKNLYSSWDSPNFITNQNKRMVNLEGHLGDIGVLFLNGVALGTTLYYKDYEGLKEYACATIFTGITTMAIKYTARRKRPDGSDNYSFPSGHSSFSFNGATFLYRRYGITWGIPAYAVASFVGFSRVAKQKHYITDVIFGAGIGIASNILFVTEYKLNIHNQLYNIHVMPYYENKKLGLYLVSKF